MDSWSSMEKTKAAADLFFDMGVSEASLCGDWSCGDFATLIWIVRFARKAVGYRASWPSRA